MLSLSQVSHAASASIYYQADNYYAKNGEHEQGQWYGQAANDLELGGQNVDPNEFVKILSGDLPNDQSLYRIVGGERKHIAGYDMTFSAPKLRQRGRFTNVSCDARTLDIIRVGHDQTPGRL